MATEQSFSWTAFRHTPIIGILRGNSVEDCRAVAEICMETGFYTLEITMNTSRADRIITQLRGDFPELNIGAGTVCNLEDYERAVGAGAQFIVTPILDEEVILGAVAENLPVFPGAFTPTEIYRAWSLGASAVKVFPAGLLGPDYLREIAAPLDEVRLLPTGGITKGNIRAYFRAGAAGVGMGSGLLDDQLLETGDFKGIRAHFRAVRAEIEDLL